MIIRGDNYPDTGGDRSYKLDVVKDAPNLNGSEKALQIIAKPGDPDLVTVNYAGSCVINSEECPSKETEKTHNKPKRLPLPKDLPRETIIHDISDADKTCTDCGHALHKMDEEKSEQLEFVPAHVKVISRSQS